MRPRLRLRFGVWSCVSIPWRAGYGYTPEEAYADWAEQPEGTC